MPFTSGDIRLAPIVAADSLPYDGSEQLLKTLPAPPRAYLRELEQKLIDNSPIDLETSVSLMAHRPLATTMQLKTHPAYTNQNSPATPLPTKTFSFVNVQTKTGKRDRAAESKIRSHAMKKIQEERRRSKIRQSSTAHHAIFTIQDAKGNDGDDTSPFSPDLALVQNTTTTLQLPRGVSREPLGTEGGSSKLTYAFLRTLLGGVECDECGNPTLTHSAGLTLPKSLTTVQPSSTTLLDPFNQTPAGPISHRMHSLLQYC